MVVLRELPRYPSDESEGAVLLIKLLGTVLLGMGVIALLNPDPLKELAPRLRFHFYSVAASGVVGIATIWFGDGSLKTFVTNLFTKPMVDEFDREVAVLADHFSALALLAIVAGVLELRFTWSRRDGKAKRAHHEREELRTSSP